MDLSEITIPKATLKAWQYLLDLAAKECAVPAALIMKVELPDIKVFLSSHSKGNPYSEGFSEPLIGSGLYCEKVVKTKSRASTANALKDKEWDKNPDIKFGMISYLGFPIFWPNKQIFGTLCILDTKENPYTEEHNKILTHLKTYIEDHLDWRMAMYSQSDEKTLQEKDKRCNLSYLKIKHLLGIKNNPVTDN